MRATTWSVPVLLLLLGLLIAKPSEGFALMRPLRHHSLISSYSSPSTTARRANTDEEAAEAAEETAAEETAAEETAAEDDPVAKAAAKKASFEKEEERIAALKARLDAANRAVSNKAGRVFVPEAAGPAFARCVAMPTVLPPSELSGGKWRMFFYGRSDDSWNGGRPAFLPTGKCGLEAYRALSKELGPADEVDDVVVRTLGRRVLNVGGALIFVPERPTMSTTMKPAVRERGQSIRSIFSSASSSSSASAAFSAGG